MSMRSRRPPIGRLVLMLVAFFSFSLGGVFLFSSSLPHGKGIVLVGQPTVVMVWNTFQDTLYLIPIPADISIEGVHGYGHYSLESLWRLDRLDKRGGRLFLPSLEETVALPVNWYIAPKTEKLFAFTTPIGTVKRLFSLLNIGFLFSQDTNLPLRTFLTFFRTIPFLRPNQIVTLDITPTLQDESLPDSSVRHTISVSEFDKLLGDRLEREDVRREHLGVAVVNTTVTPLLAQRAARLLGHLGMLVISLGNDPTVRTRCEIVGSRGALRHVTAELLRLQYGCLMREGEGVARADFTLFLGKNYEDTFLPFRRE